MSAEVKREIEELDVKQVQSDKGIKLGNSDALFNTTKQTKHPCNCRIQI